MIPSSDLLRRNVVLSLTGQVLPLVAAVVAVPALLSVMGEERFGILALAWAVLGLSAVFDLAVGRALTKMVAERVGGEQEGELPALVATGLCLTSGLGVVGGIALAGLSPWLVNHVLEVPLEMRREVLCAFLWLALAVPAGIMGTTLRGVLEARQCFGQVTAVRLPVSVLLFVAPLLVVQVNASLNAVVAVLVALRVLALLVYAHLVLHDRKRRSPPRWEHVQPILRLGGWMTVSNVVAPVLLYADRFVVGSVLSLAAVTHYATPFEVVSRLAVIPAAIMAVLFPAMSQALASPSGDARALYQRSSLVIAVAMALPLAAIAVYAKPLLTLWLGTALADASFRVAAILAVGGLAHGLAQPPFHLLQAAGRADLTARLHLVEAPVYLTYLWWLTARFGITGTAVAWTTRVAMSQLVLRLLAWRVVIAPVKRGGGP